jgi:hypothetical protein
MLVRQELNMVAVTDLEAAVVVQITMAQDLLQEVLAELMVLEAAEVVLTVLQSVVLASQGLSLFLTHQLFLSVLIYQIQVYKRIKCKDKSDIHLLIQLVTK